MNQKPLIGIPSTQDKNEPPKYLRMNKQYVRAVSAAGGNPIILPCLQDSEQIREMAELVDGLLLSGGADFDPLLFGEEPHPQLGRIDPERDFYEKQITEFFLATGKPIFGICRGLQLLNSLLGGNIYQDITAVCGGDLLKHKQDAPLWYPTHSVRVEKNSKLINVFKEGTARVNSFHHQAIDELASDFRATIFSPDGLIEGIEYEKETFIVGVQWHPEHLWERDTQQLDLFKLFVQEAGKIN